METRRIRIKDLEQNTGQIEGLPGNPRQWTRAEVERIARSLQETPELFEARPLIVIPHGDKFVILGGNLRFAGCKHNKDKDVPCFVLPEDTPIDKMKEIVIKDNGSFGSWDYDALANEWDVPFEDWGVPAWETDGKVSPDDFGTEFTLPSGCDLRFHTMSFQVSTEQRDLIEAALTEARGEAGFKDMDNYGNKNANGNALAFIVYQYGQMQGDTD